MYLDIENIILKIESKNNLFKKISHLNNDERLYLIINLMEHIIKLNNELQFKSNQE